MNVKADLVNIINFIREPGEFSGTALGYGRTFRGSSAGKG
jgi:hypothetical protein